MAAIKGVLLFTAFIPALHAGRDMVLTTEQLQTVLCVEKIAHRYFTPGRPLIVSLPGSRQEVTRRTFRETLPQADDMQLLNAILEKLNERTRWPIELFRPSGEETEVTTILHHSYIMFVWLQEGMSLRETLESQVENLKYSMSWNPRGKFLVVVTASSNDPPNLLAAQVCSTLWQMGNIVNVVVLVPQKFAHHPINSTSITHSTGPDRLDLYTWFPYKLGRCGEVQEVILMDQWVSENQGTFSENAYLYPAKIPKSFMRCPIKVATIGVDPYVIWTGNSTQNDGSTVYRVTGLSVDILVSVLDKMNLTTVFLPPAISTETDPYIKVLSDFEDGLSDVVTGAIPLLPMVVTSSYDATIPYTHNEMKMLLPCPKPIPGSEKVLTTFSLSVWLTMGLVLLLSTAVFWCVGKGPYRSVFRERHTYRSLSHCFYNVWAVFMGVSVPQLPTTSNLRVFFLVYVCYCFAISTVFQAFFVSYLVEPEYGYKIETLDELLDSDIIYGYNPGLDIIFQSVPYPELSEFNERKKLRADCGDTTKCVERIITKGDIASIIVPMYASYLASEMGIVDVNKIICSFDETIMSAGVIILFKKGNPLLDRVNVLLRRCLEACFLEIRWSELQHRAHLKSWRKLQEDSSDMFVPFSVYHLMPAFVVLVVGNIWSSVVFIVELMRGSANKRKLRIKRKRYDWFL
jgi:hypothetical protein